jgi:hypothetical protein
METREIVWKDEDVLQLYTDDVSETTEVRIIKATTLARYATCLSKLSTLYIFYSVVRAVCSTLANQSNRFALDIGVIMNESQTPP